MRGARSTSALDRTKLDRRGRAHRRADRARFPELKIPVPQPLAPFRGRRRGLARPSSMRSWPGARRWRSLRSRIDLTLVKRAARRRRRARLALPRGRAAVACPQRVAWRGEFQAFLAGPLLVGRRRLLLDGRRGRRCFKLDAAALADIFQVRASNPLVGLEGRAALMRRLGEALRASRRPSRPSASPAICSTCSPTIRTRAALHHHHPQPAPLHHHVRRRRIIAALLDAFSAIWPSGQVLHGVPVGDLAAPGRRRRGRAVPAGCPSTSSSQWLAYSLLEPFEVGRREGRGAGCADRPAGIPQRRAAARRRRDRAARRGLRGAAAACPPSPG